MDQDTDYATIEHFAYQLWMERGSPIGSPDEDWFRAELALRGDRIDEIPPNAQAAAAATDSNGSLADSAVPNRAGVSGGNIQVPLR